MEGVQVVGRVQNKKTRGAYDQLSPSEKAAVKKFWKLQKRIEKDWKEFMKELTRPV